MEEIFAFLSQIHSLSPGCLNYLRDIVQYHPISKKETILKIGQINDRLYFIKKGLLRCYYMVNDKEVSDWFFGNNEFIVSIGSFYQQLPSEDCIVVMEAGELYSITREQYAYAKKTYLEFAYIASELLEKYLVTFHNHARLLRRYQATERYQLVLEKYPELIRRIPNKHLATWLDMGAEMLSRVRSGKIY
ncbi:MAG TPA: Crp/Fnr family transcriptional regulator [Puia sp.]|jgi:CRP-like cAMP-binding protein|nr:Crp/Fnr family transcriptional regulator [Puia sp.]